MKTFILLFIAATVTTGIILNTGGKETIEKTVSSTVRSGPTAGISEDVFDKNREASEAGAGINGTQTPNKGLNYKNGYKNGNPTPLLRDLPWGYRFVKGQKLWYKRTYDQTDSTFGDSHITTEVALIEIEDVDRQGNITLTVEILDRTFAWKDEPIPHPKGLSEMVGSVPKVWARITYLGKFIDGRIVENYPDMPLPSEPQEMPKDRKGSLTPEQSSVKSDVEQWLPEWPDRDAFDRQLRYTETHSRIDTADVVFLGEEPPLPPPAEAQQEDVIGDVLMMESPLTAGKRKGEDEAGRALRDSLRRNPPVSYYRDAYEYQIDRATLKRPSTSIRIGTYHVKQQSTFTSSEFTDRWDLRGGYLFRRSDGAPLSNTREGTHRSASHPKMHFTRVELQLIRDETPKESSTRPSIR